MALAKLAKVLISAMVSTPALDCAPTMLLSKAKFSVSVAAAPILAPTKAYCAALGLLLGLGSLTLPLASDRMAV